MKKSLLSLIALSLLLLTACDQGNFYEENKVIKNRSWSYDDQQKFSVHISDARPQYDLYINVRHTPNYAFSNLFVLLHQQGPSLKDTAYRYEVKLAELDGKWLGKSAGSMFSQQLMVKENFTFPDTGQYNFAIEQNMRENPLREISDIGLKIVKK